MEVLINDIKSIIIDYIGPSELGSNKYQLNYKCYRRVS